MNEEFILKIVVDDGEFIVKLPDTEKRVKSLGKAFDVAKEKTKAYSKETENLSKKNIDLTSNAGLAGATLTEFGRTISDLPYGIRGVANNLSQLSTLFITLVAKSTDGGKSIDGVKQAFGLLINQLKGPLGFILVFQAVISLLDFFSGKTKKAEEDLGSFTDALSKNLLISEQFQKLLEDSNLSLAERERLLKAASNRHNQLQKILSDETLTQDQRNNRAERFLELEDVRLKLTKESQREEKQLFAARDNLTKKQEELNNLKSKEIELDEGFVNTAETRELATDEVAKAEKELNLVTQAFITLQGQLANVNVLQTELLKSNTKAKKDNADATKKQKEAEEAFLMDLKGIQDQARGIQFQELQTLEREEISALSRRGLSREEFEEEKLKIIQKFIQEEIKLIDFMLTYDTLTTEERLKLRSRLADLTTQTIEKEGEAVDTLFDKIMKVAIEVEKSLNHVVNAISASVDAEISQEERKTNLLNNQLKKRLRNEDLSKEERIAINKQIENNEVALQEKRDELAEKAFKAQKAAAIASALIGTAESAVDAFGTIKGMKFLGPAALPLAIAAAATATAFGLKQVDAIRRTKFVPSAAPSSSGFGGRGFSSGGGTQDPSFNIVGTGQQFQLAQVIAQRTGEPIRAFVVSGDVRTGLALDRNIINSSKIN